MIVELNSDYLLFEDIFYVTYAASPNQINKS